MIDCAVILAGGLGTRLRTVVSDRPKVMARVAGRPFITHLLGQLATLAPRTVVLCTGYMSEIVQEQLGATFCGMRLFYSREDQPLGTGGALRHASGLLSGEMVLVMNGDSYCHCDLAGFVEGLAVSGAGAGIALAHVDDVARFGAVLSNADDLVESFVEKGGEAGPGWINAGIYLLPTRIIREIPAGRQVSLEREVIPAIIPGGLYAHRCPGPFIDIGIPEEYERAQLLFSSDEKGRL